MNNAVLVEIAETCRRVQSLAMEVVSNSFSQCESAHQHMPICIWAFSEELNNISVLHPRGDKSNPHTGVLEVIYAKEWEDVGMRKLTPEDRLSIKCL